MATNAQLEQNERALNPIGGAIAQIAAPILIMLMVGSLLFFFIEVFYQGGYQARILWVFGLFVIAAVLISRISIELGFERAFIYGLGLGAAVFFVTSFIFRFEGSLALLSPVINVALIAFVWWSAAKLTWDCTVVDGSRDTSALGLIELVRRKVGNSGNGHSSTAATEDPQSQASEIEDSSQTDERPPNPFAFLFKKSRNSPGLWVLYFAGAALPIFGLGQLFLSGDPASRQFAILMFIVYMISSLGLLMTTSLLSLSRYVHSRRTVMPIPVFNNWIWLGGGFAIAVIVICWVLPRPNSEKSLAQQLVAWSTPDRDPSKHALGNDGKKQSDEVPANSTEKSSSAKNSSSSGNSKQGKSGRNSKKGKSGSGSESKGKQSSGQKSGTQSKQNKSSQSQNKNNQANSKNDQRKNSKEQNSSAADSRDKNQSKQSKRQNQNDQREDSKSGKDENNSKESNSNESNAGNNRDQENDSEQKSDSQDRRELENQRELNGRQNDQDKEKSDPENTNSGNANTQSRSRSESNSNQNSNSSSPNSNSSSSNWLNSFGSFIKYLVLALVIIGILVLAYIYRREIAKALREFWASLLGMFAKKEQAPLEISSQGMAGSLVTKPGFAEFANPFLSGKANQWDGNRVASYSYEALEAWARDHAAERKEDDTALQFGEQLAQRFSSIGESVKEAIQIYCRMSYARKPVNKEDLPSFEKLWTQLSNHKQNATTGSSS